MIIHLVRHGETVDSDRLLGRTNALLSDTGIRSVRHQLDRLTWAGVVTSPLKRAQVSALEAADRASVPCRLDNDWMEMDFGAWDGLPLERIRSEHADQFRAFYQDPEINPPPGGESWSDMAERVERGLRAIIATPTDGPIAVITHGGAIRAALSILCGLPQKQMWAIRIAHAATLTVDARERNGALEGEIVELVQAPEPDTAAA